MKKSKTIEAYIAKHPEKFESYHCEIHDGRPDHWIYCRDPYYSPDMECQTIHEYTVAEVLAKLRYVEIGTPNGAGGFGPPSRNR